MTKTRKSIARYGPVILITSAAAHSAFAPLRGRAHAAAVKPSPESQTAPDVKPADKKSINSESTADPIAGFPAGIGDANFPPLQTQLNKPVARTPFSTFLDPLPATTISLLNTSGVTAPVPPNLFEPTLPATNAKSEPANLDPGGGPIGAAPQIPTLGQVDSGPRTSKPVPEPITLIPLLTFTTLLGRPRRSTTP